MKWDTVVVSIRYGQDVEEVRTEMQFLQDCGLFETETLLVVADPCDDVGSAGSALNALLTTAEHLCARRGLSVLDESLLESSKILILQLGAPGETLPLAAGFLPSLKIAECPWIMSDYPVVHTIHNVNELAANCDNGVWICGTDTLWKLPPYPNKLNLRPDEIAAFCFEGDCQQTLSHGTYKVDEEGFVKSLSYRCQYAGDSPQVILALLYLPPSLSTRFLSLYSVYPISRSTYYGVDSGALGLKLSLFFDLIMATCLPKDEFVSTHLAANKSDRNLDVLEQSRKKIWERFHLCKCRAYCLPLIHYEYLGDLQHSGNIPPKREVIANLQNSVLSRISAMVMNDVHEYSTALLKTLMAININYPQMKKDILAVLESLCAESIPHCARALMVTAEYLAIRARGRGGLRSGPAANPAFTHIFESIKKGRMQGHPGT